MPVLHVLKVFVGADGRGGNPLGVFMDGRSVPDEFRQRMAAELGFSETVFVDDVEHGDVRIYTPASELPFAGHPLVGTSWLAHHLGHPVEILRPPAGEVPTWRAHGLTWIKGRAEWSPEMEFRELERPQDVDALWGPPGPGFTYVWAWEDAEAGVVRARVFAPEHGIEEDEATGSGAVSLAALVGRDLVIRQGEGSLLCARPSSDGTVDVGGEVVLVDEREHSV
ncbi:MAG: PhzF family phenazine biosynthesis protein [Chloroflexota bacterium]